MITKQGKVLIYGVALGLAISYVFGLVREILFRLDRIEDFLGRLSQMMAGQ